MCIRDRSRSGRLASALATVGLALATTLSASLAAALATLRAAALPLGCRRVGRRRCLLSRR
eukprot:3850323-Alexandrium_andersonii.AAC.1